PACFGMDQPDRGRQVRSEARTNISRPSSTHQLLIDSLGIDRVLLGSDWTFVPWDPSPTGWIQGLKCLGQEEKEKILYQKLVALLNL
ncbi:MAG: hypothetical protein ACE1Y2_04650, partial [Stenotrophomonas maltophilia]